MRGGRKTQGKQRGGSLRGIAQGTGRYPRRQLGALPARRRRRAPARRKRQGGLVTSGRAVQYFDAFMPQHLPLPRGIGPYSVVRTTQNITLSSSIVYFGTVTTNISDPRWSNTFAFYPSASGVLVGMSSTTGARSENFSILEADGYSRCTMVPSAFSIQIMNPEALQTTTGVVTVGRYHTMPSLMGNPGLWADVIQLALNNNAPRVMSAGKLALRGVQVDAVPYNMTSLSDFRELITSADGDFTWDRGSTQGKRHFDGFAPIFVYNPSGVSLTYLVTCEWRCRFAPENPAQSGHRMHPISSDSFWHDCVSTLTSLGHGVRDIADTVAAMGGVASAVGLI